MATAKPQLISTSKRLRIEQHIFWFERIALFLLCTLCCSLSVINSSLDQREENNLTSTLIVTALIIIIITMTNTVYLFCWMVMPENINPNPNVKTEAKAQAKEEERIAFWIERLAITFLFGLFFLFNKAPIGAIWAMAATASLFIVSNFTYLLLFLESEELYVQINNTFKALKEATQRALKEARDELWKLRTEYETEFEEQYTEYRKQCTEYKKQCTENKKKLEEKYNEAIEECKKHYQMKLKGGRSCKEQCTEYKKQRTEDKKKLEEEYNEAIEECNKCYRMKLKEKEDKWGEDLKKLGEGKTHFAKKLIVENIERNFISKLHK